LQLKYRKILGGLDVKNHSQFSKNLAEPDAADIADFLE